MVTTFVEQKSKDTSQHGAFPKLVQASMGRSDEDDDGYMVVPACSYRVQQRKSFPRIGQASLGHSDKDNDGHICASTRIREVRSGRSNSSEIAISSFDHRLPESADDADIQLQRNKGYGLLSLSKEVVINASSPGHKTAPLDNSGLSAAARTSHKNRETASSSSHKTASDHRTAAKTSHTNIHSTTSGIKKGIRCR